MVNKVCVLLLSCVGIQGVSSAWVTNVSQVINCNVNSVFLSKIDVADRSTPDTLYLAFLKSTATADLTGFLGMFDDAYALEEFGMNRNSSLTDAMKSGFNAFMNSSGVTNRVLLSYVCLPTNSNMRIHSQMRVETPHRTVLEDVDLVIKHVADGWRILRWNNE